MQYVLLWTDKVEARTVGFDEKTIPGAGNKPPRH
jgi:hypothetical protein